MVTRRHILSGLLAIGIVFALSSCSLLGINMSRNTPKKGYSYPTFTKKDSIRGALHAYRTCYDVLHYTLDIDINPDKKYISGSVDMEFLVTSTCKTLQIDLFKNMKMDSILHNGKKLDFTRKYDAVYVHFHDSLHKGSIHAIQSYYQGKPIVAPKPPWDGGFVWKQSENKKPWVGVACEVTGASLWWPCKDHISDEPDSGMIMRYRVPQGLTLVGNGVLNESYTKNGKTFFEWQTQYPINNYNVTFYLGDYIHFSEEYKGVDTTFTLDYYVLPEYLEKSKEVFTQTAGIIRFFETIYGPYPWSKEGFKLVGSPYEGMEHQTAIAYGTGFRKHYLGFDYIILHETAHEWWGNSVSVADFSDIFIHEGFATYSEVLYIEHMYGKANAEKYLLNYAYFIKNKNPIVGPRDVNFWDYNDTDPYLKGAWVLHGLRHVIHNDSLFFGIIKSFYLKNAYNIVSVQDFIDHVNIQSRQDLSWYFKQYLYMREVPKLQYTADISANDIIITMRWTNVHPEFVMPIEINVNNIPIRIEPTTEVQKYTFHNFNSLEINTKSAYFATEKVKSIQK